MSFLGKNVDTLKNMNSTTSKYAKWFVRIIHPKVIDYTFRSRSEVVNAQKFECLLVSQDEAQYMFGSVPFVFADREAAKKAFSRFIEDHVFEITTPAFDSKARPEYNGCPVKPVLLLSTPTTITKVPPANMEIFNYPAKGITVSIDITDLVRILKDSGSAKSLNKTFDFHRKFLGNTIVTPAEKKAGVRRRVSEATFVDENGSKVLVSVLGHCY